MNPTRKHLRKFLVGFALLYFPVALFSAFLHQTGHGFGALLDGVRLSTGVAMAGDYGKTPLDPDFRAQTPVPGRVTSGGLLGPFVNWMIVVAGCMYFLRRPRASTFALVVVAFTIANSWIRLFPDLRFLATHLHGPLFLDDEATWALATIPDFQWPASFQTLELLSGERADLVKGRWVVYAWPLFSATLSAFGLWVATRATFRMWSETIATSSDRVLFFLIPILGGPIIYPIAFWLDVYARINWG